ncbi:MAG: 30S ribosomal protein S17 [Acidobacteria bacterium]|jgi:small subunit ribosomal protein S17|nr:30S ribosomal protein S17 [Acidobacteriota bacterium]
MENENQEVKEKENKETAKTKVGTILTGEVVSTKADKTVSVYVERIFQHPVYKKIVRRKKKYLVHDEHNKCKSGDTVRIRLVRPISKKKRWLLIDIVSTAPKKEEEVSQ